MGRLALLVTLWFVLSVSSLVVIPEKASSYSTHDPIRINGDSNFTSENGVAGGSGTPSDPYIIEGWEINASMTNGIVINGTEAHFVIRNVYVHSGILDHHAGIQLENVTNGRLENVTVIDNHYGIYLWYSSSIVVKDSVVLSWWGQLHLTDGISVFNSLDIVLAGNHIGNTSHGITVAWSSYINIAENSVTEDGTGILLCGVDNASITGNQIERNAYDGVQVIASTNVTIAGNIVSNNRWRFADTFAGIYVGTGVGGYCGNVTITANNVTSNRGHGILISADNVIVEDNNISDNLGYGLWLMGATNTTIRRNAFYTDGMVIYGPFDATHIITSDNSINGLPLHYYSDCSNLDLDGSLVGQLIVMNCTNVRVSNLRIADTDVGIQMVLVDNATVAGNMITSNRWEGILLWQSSNLTVQGNIVSATPIEPSPDISELGAISQMSGIGLRGIAYATVSGNMVSGSGVGIHIDGAANSQVTSNRILNSTSMGVYVASADRVAVTANYIHNTRDSRFGTTQGRGIALWQVRESSIANNRVSLSNVSGIAIWHSSNDTIQGNTFVDSGVGIEVNLSGGMQVHHNNIVNNGFQALDDGGPENSWDYGYPSGGNHWSVYAGVDECSGPNQDICPDPDGIGDTPYVIDSDSKDVYPLMWPYGPLYPDEVPPVVSTPMASPEPTEVFEEMEVSVTARDDVGVEHVWMNVTDTKGQSTNISMSRMAGYTWYQKGSYSALGEHDVVVWALDAAGNAGHAYANFVVVDTTAPEILSVSAVPSRQEPGWTVDFSAAVIDNYALTLVEVETLDPGGDSTGSFEMTFSEGDGRYHHSSSHDVLGNWTYQIQAQDSSGNTASASGGFEIIDETSPSISNVSAIPSPQNLGGEVDISALVTDNQALSLVEVEVFDPDGISIGSFEMTLNEADGRFHHSSTYNESGQWTFVIHARDGSGNIANASGSFVIINPPPPPTGGSETIYIAAGSIVVVTTSALLWLEPVRIALLTLLFALARHFKPDTGEDPETRGMIRGYIRVNPGDTYTDIARNLGLNNGSLTWHLMKLQKAGVIKSRIRGGRKRYYPADAQVTDDGSDSLHEVQRQILSAVKEDPGVLVAVVAEHVRLTHQTTLYHMRKLREKGLLSLERQGMRLRAYPAAVKG